jgi:tRNA (guanine10-N2)-dimethyltransferase
MKILFELAKDHATIPNSEVYCCLKAENIQYNTLEENNDVIVIESNCKLDEIKKLHKRFSSVFFADIYLFDSTLNNDTIEKKAEENPISVKGSIAVKYKNRSTKQICSQDVIKSLARVYTKKNKVSLNKPDNEIRAIITDEKVYVGLKLFEVNRSIFEERKVQNRPFFSPISLHPRIACGLVNISCVKKDELLLDPFCGTGGIILEAGLIGAKIIGSDIEEKMINGCRKTLEKYNIKDFDLFCVDIGNISSHVTLVDAVVTDMPYGKSTTTKGEDRNDLYDRAFESIAKILKKGKRAVIGLPNSESIQQVKKYLTLIETHEIKAHKSLTRYFSVFEKK